MGLVEGVLAGLWLLVAGLATLSTAMFLRGLGPAQPDPGPFPPVLVALPVRTDGTAALAEAEACLIALEAQDYPGPWRVAMAVEDAAEPAVALPACLGATRVSVVVAGPAEGRAQKVHNLLAALATRRAEEVILVTLDADTLPPPGWLREQTRPLRRGQAEIASGYRWALPEGGLAARLGGLADRGPATCARLPALALAWGGSTAISATGIARLDLQGVWARALSDDLALTRAAHHAGLRVFMSRRVLLPSPVRHDWPALLSFGRRQGFVVRLYMPRAWAVLGVALLVPTLAAPVTLAAALGGSMAAGGVVVACLALQQFRAGLRVSVARRILPADVAARAARDLPRDRLLLPLAHLVFVAAFLGSAMGRRLRWRGHAYAVAGRDALQVTRSDEATRQDV